jgi:hypothetical protein
MYQCTFNILAYPSSLSTVISLDAFVLSTVVAGALSYPACFCFAKGTQRSSERKNCTQIPREIQIALSASATYALAPCLFLTRRRRWTYDEENDTSPPDAGPWPAIFHAAVYA